MSLYTNDIDTLRQMTSQSMRQLLNSAITVVSVLVSMVVLSVPLTVLTLVMVGIMLLVTKYLTTNSSKYFVSQQRDIGAVNGYIEEMMNGQKVVKVFCHEEEAIEQFDKLNDQLFESADKANRYSNLGGPANTQLGNPFLCVLCHDRWCAGSVWHDRPDPGQAGQLFDLQPHPEHAHQPDLHAVQRHHHGSGRRPAYL